MYRYIYNIHEIYTYIGKYTLIIDIYLYTYMCIYVHKYKYININDKYI